MEMHGVSIRAQLRRVLEHHLHGNAISTTFTLAPRSVNGPSPADWSPRSMKLKHGHRSLGSPLIVDGGVRWLDVMRGRCAWTPPGACSRRRSVPNLSMVGAAAHRAGGRRRCLEHSTESQAGAVAGTDTSAHGDEGFWQIEEQDLINDNARQARGGLRCQLLPQDSLSSKV